jgi:hypothetical protein
MLARLPIAFMFITLLYSMLAKMVSLKQIILKIG